MEDSPDGQRTFAQDGVLRGVHRGSVVVESGALEVVGSIQGSLYLAPGSSVEIKGLHEGYFRASSDASVVVAGTLQGDIHVERAAKVLVEPGGKLRGEIDNEGTIIVRGVFGGPLSGSGELRLEDEGHEKPARRVDDSTYDFDW